MRSDSFSRPSWLPCVAKIQLQTPGLFIFDKFLRNFIKAKISTAKLSQGTLDALFVAFPLFLAQDELLYLAGGRLG